MRHFLISLFVCIFTFCFSSYSYVGGHDPGHQLPASVRIIMNNSACTGVKIGLKQILTAAHCNLLRGLLEGSTITLTDSRGTSSSETSGKGTRVKSFHTHPTWPSTGIIPETAIDLAIIEVEDETPFLSIATLSQRLLETGDEVVVGGFGVKGREFPMYPHLTIAFKSVKENRPSQFTVGVQDVGNESLSAAGKGDSGGAAYWLNETTGEFQVVGINSAATHNEARLNVDPQTGALKSYDGLEPILLITKLVTISNSNETQPITWIKDLIR